MAVVFFGHSIRSRDSVSWAPGYDRRHDLNVVATWRMASYRIGTRFGFATGTPYTPIVGQIVRRAYDPSLDHWGTGDPQLFLEPLGGVRNSARFPASHRLDVDVSREYLVRGATFAPYLSVANAYNAKNVFVYLYDYSTDALRHVFIPGFPQAVTVSAVDSNYYDWYRSHDDAISGAGLVNRVQGGLGVFGSLVRLRYQELTVVAPQSGPAAGTFVPVGSPQELSFAPYLQLQVYVESPAARGDQADALSGRSRRRVTLGDAGCAVCGVLGTTRDGHIELALLRGWSATDTMEVFTGEIRGDTIVGSYRGLGGVAHFVRVR